MLEPQADTVFEPKQPGPLIDKPERAIKHPSAIPQTIDDLIVPVGQAGSIAFHLHVERVAVSFDATHLAVRQEVDVWIVRDPPGQRPGQPPC